MRRKLFTHTPTINPRWLAGWSFPVADRPDAAVAALTGNLDPSVLAAMDKDALKKQIENMKYQATMERWPLSKSIAAIQGRTRWTHVYSFGSKHQFRVGLTVNSYIRRNVVMWQALNQSQDI
ncbi:unnamed protein product [Timema podura]|uniref:Uncharacterized protein n=1 Tax=Timema podura TaxID=61482 RepID=A0ABN7NFU8_TIMPD|nr:unnamed protein product [Timema podura]